MQRIPLMFVVFGGTTSTERNVLAADVDLSWDGLDFGLSYVRASRVVADRRLLEALGGR